MLLKRLFRRPPPSFIAEIGINHNGSLELAQKLIQAAQSAGADAVKFQFFRASELASEKSLKASYIERAGVKESLASFFRRHELSFAQLQALSEQAKKLKISFFASSFSPQGVRQLAKLRVPIHKVASRELTHTPLLQAMAKEKKPIFLSTGMATEKEIEKALQTIKTSGNPPVVLFHCVSAYPTPEAQVNLLSIPYLARRFHLPTGFSDHTVGISFSLAAIALGALAIEKHFTLSKELPGPDHPLSATPEEFAQLVTEGRKIFRGRGQEKKHAMPCEMEVKKMARRSLVAKRDLSRGTRLTAPSLACIPPEDGLPPTELSRILGRKLARNLRSGDPLTEKDLQ